jgi:hypothetical protein
LTKLTKLCVVIDWISGLFYAMLCYCCFSCWSISSCIMEYWRFSNYAGVFWNHDLVVIYTSFWRGINLHLQQVVICFVVLRLGFSLLGLTRRFCLFAAKEGVFVDGFGFVSGCLYWSLDWFGYCHWF